MIVTIRSNNGFYRAVEYNEFKKDWWNYFNNLRDRVDFRFCKNFNKYRFASANDLEVFKDTFAPSFIALREKVETY